MLVIVDTDIVNKLSRRSDFKELSAHLRKHCIQITVSETVAKEVLVTADHTIRAALADTLIDLLGECPLLAPLPYQVKWGVQSFLDGKTAFKPFRTSHSDDIKTNLRNAKFLQDTELEMLRQELADGVSRWDNMHNSGRTNMQDVREEKNEVPDEGDWMRHSRVSSFTHEIVLSTISNPTEQEELKPLVAEYIGWNPVCRCFLEQLMLAIRRHGLEHKTASSKKGPKWADYYISAFVGITDCFVTDDTRLRRALEQHRCLRSTASWELRSLMEFIEDFRNDRILDYATNRALETLPAVGH